MPDVGREERHGRGKQERNAGGRHEGAGQAKPTPATTAAAMTT